MASHGPHSPQGRASGGGYAKAADSYQSTGGGQENQRETEAKVLLKAARMIQDLHDSWDDGDVGRIEKAIAYNRQVWTVFYDSALNERKSAGEAAANTDNKIRNNIVSLASFVFQRSLDIMAEPARDKLVVLITINREIAAGLMQQRQDAAL